MFLLKLKSRRDSDMISDSKPKEVRFDKYCPKCIQWNGGKESMRCDECLEEPTRLGTEKPLYYEES